MIKSPAIRLSPQQTEVVTHIEGPILVEAGPGSGKTRVLTERIRYLLNEVPSHFRILALTFTNKAADEMKDRLADLGEVRDRAFIGTLHGFCLEFLTERGKLIGIEGNLNIFEQLNDRKEILLRAVIEDPFLSRELENCLNKKEIDSKIHRWLSAISFIKSHPLSKTVVEDELEQRVLDAYDAGMNACNSYDFDDLLLLTYKLLIENPKLANIYRKIYKFICIDESQDMNEAQYAVICALCSDEQKNVMMVGDPRQSIYGFNTSGPEYMARFGRDFKAKKIELTANYRSSKEVVRFAQSLDPNYMVATQLPIAGETKTFKGQNEKDEARLIINHLEHLLKVGHPDVEGEIKPDSCAILGRTRYALLAIENELKERNIQYYKRLSANHENTSDTVDEFQMALKVLSNPQDQLHLSSLASRWEVELPFSEPDFVETLQTMSEEANNAQSLAIYKAIEVVGKNTSRLDLMPALKVLEEYADTLDEANRLEIYEDVAVLRQEWDQYIRAASGTIALNGFLSKKALGGTQKSTREGVALLTIHSSKGLEFDVVFIAGMAEGSFPDYRATNAKAMAEETRNAFVAATRAKRLLFLSFAESRFMPWGGIRRQQPSRFLNR